MKPIAEIFSQGSEILSGQTVDSNAAWLSQQLTEEGFELARHTTVGDSLVKLIEVINEISERADCCLCTGGLGPTCDDLTTEAVSLASSLPLEFNQQAFEQIENYYASRNRTMPEANRKQAFIPTGAEIIPNPIGTAPGFRLKIRRCLFVFLPGVPKEMKWMFDHTVRRDLRSCFVLQKDHLITLRTMGIGESAIQDLVKDYSLPIGVTMGFRAGIEEVQTKLLFDSAIDSETMNQVIGDFKQRLGSHVFAIERNPGSYKTLLDILDEWFLQSRFTIRMIETASFGSIAARCMHKPWFISSEIEKTLFADAEQQAIVLASQLRQNFSNDLALVQTYKGTPEVYASHQGVIQVFNVLHTFDEVLTSEATITGPLEYKNTQAAMMALDLLRRYFQKLCLSSV